MKNLTEKFESRKGAVLFTFIDDNNQEREFWVMPKTHLAYRLGRVTPGFKKAYEAADLSKEEKEKIKTANQEKRLVQEKEAADEGKKIVDCLPIGFASILGETEQAIEIVSNLNKRVWLPKSQIHNICREEGKEGALVPIWLFNAKPNLTHFDLANGGKVVAIKVSI